MTTCVNCGYRRQEQDGGSQAVCPKCNMPYEWSAAGSRLPMRAEEPETGSGVPGRVRAVRGVSARREQAAAGDGVMDTIVFAIVLALGCFMPLMSVPIVGSVTATQLEFSDGYILLGLAAVAVWLAYTGKVSEVRWPGFVALGIVAANFVHVVVKVRQVKADVRADLVGNPFAGLAEAMLQSVQLQWGWVPLMVGAVGLVAVGYGKRLPLKR